MKKTYFTLITLCLCTSLVAEQETKQQTIQRYRCDDYDSRDASVLSMMGWGIGIAIGIAALCALLDNNPGTTTN